MCRADLDTDLDLARAILGQRYAVDRVGQLLGMVSDPPGAAIDDVAAVDVVATVRKSGLSFGVH